MYIGKDASINGTLNVFGQGTFYQDVSMHKNLYVGDICGIDASFNYIWAKDFSVNNLTAKDGSFTHVWTQDLSVNNNLVAQDASFGYVFAQDMSVNNNSNCSILLLYSNLDSGLMCE